MNPASCVILVPARGSISPECEQGLQTLERRGYAVRRAADAQTVEVVRATMVRDSLAAGFDELMWIDGDISFHPGDVEKLRRHGQPVVCGIYPKVRSRELACAFLPGTEKIQFGEVGGLVEILYGPFGFMLTRREVFEEIRRQLSLPECNQRFGSAVVPWFMPLLAEDGSAGPWYLTDDFALCERARRCQFKIMADSSIRLWRMGLYAFGWEDAGSDKQEYASYIFHLPASMPLTSTAPLSPVTPAAEAEGQPATQPGERGLRSNPPRMALHELPRPLRDDFPRYKAYVVSYPANHESLQETLQSYRQSDWVEEPRVFMQPADWPVGTQSAASNYKRALAAAIEDDCDFAVISEDDVRVNRHLRRNLEAIPLLRRDQCDYFSLFMPDLIASPWERQEPHLGYRLAKSLYAGPNRMWEKYRIWGAQTYVLSRRFILAALERWDRLAESQDTRVVSVCSELRLPMWYSAPCLIQHAPLRSAFSTPTAYAPDFDGDFIFQVGSGYQAPEGIAGWLTCEEGKTLWELAAGRDVLELGTTAGRATVCLCNRAGAWSASIRSIKSKLASGPGATAWRVGSSFCKARSATAACALGEQFDLVLLDTEHDAESFKRDLDAALPRLRRGGYLAVHDYPDPDWPEVRLVVDEYARRLNWKRHAQVDYLGVFRT